MSVLRQSEFMAFLSDSFAEAESDMDDGRKTYARRIHTRVMHGENQDCGVKPRAP